MILSGLFIFISQLLLISVTHGHRQDNPKCRPGPFFQLQQNQQCNHCDVECNAGWMGTPSRKLHTPTTSHEKRVCREPMECHSFKGKNICMNCAKKSQNCMWTDCCDEHSTHYCDGLKCREKTGKPRNQNHSNKIECVPYGHEAEEINGCYGSEITAGYKKLITVATP